MNAKEIFSAYDEEGDGMIDAIHIGNVCRALGLKPTEKMVLNAVGKPYEKGQYRVNYEAFRSIYEALKKERPMGNFHVFCDGLKVLDKDRNGKLTLSELQRVLQSFGERLSKTQVNDICDGMYDEKGNVDYTAFVTKVMNGPFADDD